MEMTRRLLFTLFGLMLTGFQGFAQPFAIGHLSTTYTDAARSRPVPVESYYPADQAGDGVPVAAGNGEAYPLLVFGHGFVMSWDAYQNIWEAVVPAGYIIAFPRTETGLSPQHAALGQDIAFVRSALLNENSDPSDLFYQRVATASAAMGHSMGGGASFLAAAQDTGFRVLVNFAAAETTPSAITAAAGIDLPALLFAGENDCVTPIAAHQQPMYDALGSNCRNLVTIRGGSHCQMAESNFYCNIGEASCTPAPAISRAVQHDCINRFLLPWLDAQLKADCAAGLRFDSLVLNDTSVSVQRTCAACVTTAITPPVKAGPSVTLSPSGDQLLFSGLNLEAGDAIRLSDLSGRELTFHRLPAAANELQLNLPVLPPGAILLRLERNSMVIWAGKVLR